MRSLLFALSLAAALPSSAVRITEYALPTANSHPLGIAVAHNGVPFFTEFSGNKIGYLADGTIHELPLATAGAGPYGIAAGSELSLYFTEFLSGHAGFVFQDGSGLDEFVLGTNPRGLVIANDGTGPSYLWFTDEGNDTVVDGDGTKLVLSAGSSPLGITWGPDGYAYFTESANGKIGAVLYSAEYVGGLFVKEAYTSSASSVPVSITTGPDGALWFTERGANKIGRMPVARIGWGAIVEYPIPTANAGLDGIAIGPDGNVWFTEQTANRIGRMDLSGNMIREYVVPTAASQPTGICADASGNVWFTEYAGNKIGKIQVFLPGDVDDDGSVDVSDVFYLINFLFAGGPAPM